VVLRKQSRFQPIGNLQMRTKHYQSYLEDEVLTATPLRLIQLLYRGALDSITSARRYLNLGDIRARSRAISKAVTIVTELSLSLDHAKGGDLSKNLAEVYAYTQTLLIEANVKQSDLPLQEAESLLSTLMEAWQSCPVPQEQAGGHVARQGPGIPHQPVSRA
jgi:flagellar protein FliS